jgi:hypothetical protein
MNSFTKHLLLLIGGIVGTGLLAVGITVAVQYRPWGVPEHRLEDYHQIVSRLDERDRIRAQWRNKPKPVVHVPVTSHHFGLVDPESIQTHSFEIHNRGDEPMTIEFGHADQDSLRVLIESPTVAPGESTRATLEWQVGSVPEERQLAATIITNDPLTGRVDLRVSGKVKADWVFPDRVSFGPSDPAQPATAEFVIASHRWESMSVEQVACDLNPFEWHAQPIELSELEGEEADGTRSAWRVLVSSTQMKYGRFDGTLRISVRADGNDQPVVREIPCGGRVRSPIIFHSPEIHMAEGLDLGTLSSGKEQNFHLVVRLRGELDRRIEVLDVQPAELRATLQPLQKAGDYRLTVTVPADCPNVVFNIDEQHGYVHVGDPNDKNFANWFPLRGAVVAAAD